MTCSSIRSVLYHMKFNVDPNQNLKAHFVSQDYHHGIQVVRIVHVAKTKLAHCILHRHGWLAVNYENGLVPTPNLIRDYINGIPNENIFTSSNAISISFRS